MNLVEKLLQLDKKDVRNSKTGTYKSGNMQQLVGDPTITIQEIDAERLMELQTLPLDKAGNYNFQQGYAANLMTVAEGVINPDLKSKELQEHLEQSMPLILRKFCLKQKCRRSQQKLLIYQVQMLSMTKN